MVHSWLSRGSLRQAHGPNNRENCSGGVVAMSGYPDHAAIGFGDGRGGTMFATERAQGQYPPVGRTEKRAGDWEASGVRRRGLAHPHDATEIVDVVGATGASAEGPQIDHPGLVRPQERVTAAAHDLRSVVDSQSDAGSRPQ